MKYLKFLQQFTNFQLPTYPISEDIPPRKVYSRMPPPPSKDTVEKSSETVPVFLTKESIVTFPIASAAVVIIWKVLGKTFPNWGASDITLLFIGLGVGILLYFIGIDEKADKKQKIISFVIAIVNSFFLIASALGLLQSVS